MEQIIFRPKLHCFQTAEEFAQCFRLNRNDLILTNRYIYAPYFNVEKYPVQTIFLEDYGVGEPTDDMVNAVIRAACSLTYHRIIAIGGGSVLDTAKVLAVSEGRDTDTLYEIRDQLKKTCPLVLVPTTCGTGSEVTNIAIMTRLKLNTKMGLTCEATYGDDAVLIPQLLEKLPFSVFATSSIDALVHAVESSLSPKATPYTRLFGYKAIEMIITSYQKLLADGKDCLSAYAQDFLLAADYAGLAFGTAGCAAVHALSYPLSGVYHVPHGESNYAMFTGVLKNYMEIKSDGAIAELNAMLATLLDCPVESAYEELENLLNQLLPKKSLHEYGVKPQELETFTDSVIKTQDRLMNNNFVKLDRARILKIYRELY